MFLNNKYKTWYFNIIENSFTREINGYCEKHHIVPRSMGGSNQKNNIAKLTAKEHFICHLLLTKITSNIDRQKMCLALWRFVHQKNSNHKISARSYEYIKKVRGEVLSERMKNNNPMHNPIYRANHRSNCPRGSKNGMFGKPGPNRGKFGNKHHLYGKKRPEHAEIMRSKNTFPREIYQCENCGKESNIGNYKRWHGHNCSTLSPSKE